MIGVGSITIVTIITLVTAVFCSEKVTIQRHLIISQPSEDSDRLAEFINSQSCLYNLNRKYELTNEEFDHINDSKYPQSRLQEQLQHAVTSRPDKVGCHDNLLLLP